MKITQTDNQIQLKTSGLGQLIVGIVLIAAGVGMAILLPGSTEDNGKKAPAWLALIGVALALGGIAAIIFAKNRSVTIQKGGDTTVTAKKVIGGSAQAQTVPTANIVAVRLSTYIDNMGNTGGNNTMGNNRSNSRRSILSLVLNNNDLIEVGDSSHSGGFSINGMNVSSLITKAPLSKEANQVATFLSVPLQADDTSSIAGAVQSVRSAFQHGSSQQPVQPTSFNPNPQAVPPQAPQAPLPPAAPVPPVSPPAQVPPTPPQTPPQVPPAENPGTPTPPPPYTPQPPAAPTA